MLKICRWMKAAIRLLGPPPTSASVVSPDEASAGPRSEA